MEIHLCSDSDGETSRGKFLFVGYILVDAWTDSCSCKKKKLFFLSFFMLYIGIKVALRACSVVNRCFSVESITFYLNCNWKLASW